MNRAAIIGAGAWGTALARHLANQGERVRLWSWDQSHAAAIQRDRENQMFFPGVRLPDSVRATGDLAEALDGAGLVVFVVPSQAFRETLTCAKPWVPVDAALVSATKGIENNTLMLMSEIIQDVLGPDAARRSSCLSGPSFANEVAAGHPTYVVLASSNHDLCLQVQRRLATSLLRIYSSGDPIGVEVGGALKNVIAIAAGACDGLGFGYNSRAALITRGLAEITRVAVAKGGDARTLSGLAGMGDLVLTCTGELSRNRTVGFRIGAGSKLDDVLRALGHVAEGVSTAKSAAELAARLQLELPICSQVYQVLYHGKPPRDAVRDVLGRPLKREAD